MDQPTFKWEQKAREYIDSEGNVKTIDREFSGHVLIKVPKHVERLRYLTSLKSNISASGSLEEKEASELENMEKVFEFVKKHIAEVDLKRIEDGLSVTSPEWLEYDKDGARVLREIGDTLMYGIKLGKS